MSGDVFNMDELAEAIRAALGVPVVVEMTGGGTATMYVGERVNPDAVDEVWRFPVVLGPGVFGYGVHPSWGNWGDFVIGPDNDGDAAVYTDETWTIARAVDCVRENFAVWDKATRDFVAACEADYGKGEVPGYWIAGGA